MTYPSRDNEFIAWYPNKLSAEQAQMPWQAREAAFYVHLPFCTAICDYCGFAVSRLKDASVDRYIEALCSEIRALAPRLHNYRFTCGHFGGGTPSVLTPEQFSRVCDVLRESIHITDNAEITVEVNPLSIDDAKLDAYQRAGVNRVSIGIQSFDNATLKIIGRPHRDEDAHEAFRAVRAHGYENISVDLIYGVPGQTISSLENDLRTIVELGPTHLSCFRLEIIPFTVLKFRQTAGLLPAALDQSVVDDYERVVAERLGASGYNHYGAFNFSLPGYESVHNRIAFVAPQGEYVGFGNSAYSFIDSCVYCNIADVAGYVNASLSGQSCVSLSRRVDAIGRMERYFVLGLKFFEVSRSKFDEQFGVQPEVVFGERLERLVKEQLLEQREDAYLLTELGRRYVNNVSKEFYSKENAGVSQFAQFVPTISVKQIEHFYELAEQRGRV